nr:hypothetical protein [Actinomycetota bacterium]
ERYNTIFNASGLPVYRGGHLSVPGLSAAFTPRAHQLDAAWRMMSEPTVLLAHFVGAGKTATMIIGGRELKRLGLINKPAYVVPGLLLGLGRKAEVRSRLECGPRMPQSSAPSPESA